MDIIETSEQKEIIISLLGRLAFPEETLKKIITKKKQNPAAYIKGYNALDGKKGITEVAKLVGVSQPTMTFIMQSWKKKGIVYQKGRNYAKLYYLKEDKEDEKNVNKPTESDGKGSQTDGLDNPLDVEEPRESKPEQDNIERPGFGTI